MHLTFGLPFIQSHDLPFLMLLLQLDQTCSAHSLAPHCTPRLRRLASIYKPERRKALQDAGFTLVGSIGDQFSDLSGLYPATASWKLPNPMYTIL